MSIGVRELRLSFIWSDFNPALFAEPIPAVPAAFLGREKPYSDHFLVVQSRYDHPDGYTPPWPNHRGKEFWGMYLGKDPYYVDAARAWKHFVPFRMRLKVSAESTRLLTADVLLYPHGCALLVQARVRPASDTALSLEEAVQLAHALRFSEKLTVANVPGVEKPLAMNSFSTAVRSAVANKLWNTGQDAPFREPYTVATFVRLDGVDFLQPVEANGPVHRALEAVTYWPTAWETAPLHALPDETTDHVYYNGPRGHTTWYPALATESPLRHRKLSCYHRNQTFAALQVQVLSDLVRETAHDTQSGATIPLAQDQCARHAIGLLSRLYGGAADTYRTAACRDHVGRIKAEINFLRNLYALPPIA